MSFRFVSAAATALSLAALVACTETPKLSAEVPALVNGAPITRVEVDRAAKALLAQSGMAQPFAEDTVKKATEAAVDQLVMAELLYQEAKKLEVKDLERLVSDRISQGRSRYPSEAEYEKALKGVDMTQKDVETAIRKDIVIANLIAQRFASRAEVTDPEIRKFYDDNRDKIFKKAGFDEVKGEIAVFIKQSKVRKAVTEYADQLRAKAKIEKV